MDEGNLSIGRQRKNCGEKMRGKLYVTGIKVERAKGV